MLDKCDCCSHFAVSEKSLRPSGAEIKLSIVAYAPDRVGCKEQNENRDSINITTNTTSLDKEFSKILIFVYFGHLKTGFDVFFDADSESPRMT